MITSFLKTRVGIVSFIFSITLAPCLGHASELTDSTNIKQAQVTPASGKVVVDETKCISTDAIQAIFLANNSFNFGNEQLAKCPSGYVAHGMKSDVEMGLGSGVFMWKSYCCPLVTRFNA